MKTILINAVAGSFALLISASVHGSYTYTTLDVPGANYTRAYGIDGGILETAKWASMCERYHIVLAPHQACGPVSLLACAHIDASITNFLIQECNVDVDDPLYKDLFSPMPVIKDSYLELPDRPGLGIELNEETAENYP